MFGFPRFWPPLKWTNDSPVNGFMLLSSASAMPDTQSASAVAVTSCLVSKYWLPNMMHSLKLRSAVKKSALNEFRNIRCVRLCNIAPPMQILPRISKAQPSPLPLSRRERGSFCRLSRWERPTRESASGEGKNCNPFCECSLERVLRRGLEPVQVPLQPVLGLAIRVDVFETQVAVRNRAPDQVDVRRASALVGAGRSTGGVILAGGRQHEVRTQLVKPVVATRGKPTPLFRQTDLPVAADDPVREEAIRIAADRITGARREAEVVLADGRDDAANAHGAAQLLVHNRWRLGVDPNLPHQAMYRNLAYRRVE